MFLSHMEDNVEAFHLKLVVTTYVKAASSKVRSEFWNMVFTMMILICRYLRNVRVESETSYGYEDKVVMDVQ